MHQVKRERTSADAPHFWNQGVRTAAFNASSGTCHRVAVSKVDRRKQLYCNVTRSSSPSWCVLNRCELQQGSRSQALPHDEAQAGVDCLEIKEISVAGLPSAAVEVFA